MYAIPASTFGAKLPINCSMSSICLPRLPRAPLSISSTSSIWLSGASIGAQCVTFAFLPFTFTARSCWVTLAGSCPSTLGSTVTTACP